MARFNTTVPTTNKKVKNLAGGTAFSVGKEMELYLLACATMLEGDYYETGKKKHERIETLVKECDPEFTARLAVYVRNIMYLRTISHVLVVELAHFHKGIAQDAIEKVCLRPDDMTEILAYQISKYGRTIPHQIKKGIGRAIHTFDEFQLAKYNGGDKKVKIKDVIRLTHPKHSDLLKKVLDDTLATPYTWEVELSKGGDKKQTWTELVNSKKMGYMGVLRNLRNILEHCDEKEIKAVAAYIADPQQVEKAGQLPFRFYSAYRELQDASLNSPYTTILLQALEKAATAATRNIHIEGTSLIAADVSGSMEGETISPKSKIRYIDVALMMAGMAKVMSPNSLACIFGENCKIKNYSGLSVFEPILTYKPGEVGHSTNGYLAVKFLNQQKIKVDNIMMFTDCELYDDQYSGAHELQAEVTAYKKNINPEVKVYIFNLAGHATVQAKGNNVFNISGWSDRIFDYLGSYGNSEKILQQIKEIVL